MLILKYLEVEKFVLYRKKTRFTFDAPLSLIYGRNLNAKDGLASNGSGKSLLFSAIPLLLFSTTPTYGTKRETSKFWSKGMSIELGFELEGSSYVVRREAQKSTPRLTITKDGEDLSFQTNTEANNFLAELIPLTEEEFFSRVFVDSSRLSAFLVGTSAERYHFIRGAFRLDRYGSLHEEYKKEAQDLKVAALELSHIRNELESLESLGIDTEDLRGVHSKLQEEFDDLTSQVASLPKRQQQLQSYIRYLDELSELEEVREELKFPALDSKLIKEKESRLRDILEDILTYEKELDKYLVQKVETRKYKAALAELREDVQEHLQGDSITREIISSAQALVKEIESLQSEMASLPSVDKGKWKSQEAVQQALDEKLDERGSCQAQIQEQTKLISNLSKLAGSQTCPLCMSYLDKTQVRSLLANCKEKQGALQDELDNTISPDIKLLKKLRDSFDSDKEKVKLEKRIKKLQGELAELPLISPSPSTPWASLRKYASLLESPLTITRKKPDKPKVMLSVQEVSDVIARLRTLRTRLTTLHSIEANLPKSIRKLDSATARKQLSKTEKLHSQLQDQLHALSQELGQLNLRLDNASNNASKYKDLASKKEKIQEKTKLLPVYEALEKAYAPKGMQTLMVIEIAKILEKQLNQYAPLVYREPFSFSLQVTDREFHILVTRNGRPSDVKHLSGAERRIFNLLLIFSMVSIMESSRRTNVLILDEPTTNLDDSYKTNFINDFLPLLQQAFSSVVIITPLNEEHYSGARIFRVEKKGKTSTLHQLS